MFLLKLSLVICALGMIWLDIAVLDTQMLEVSFTEIGQEVMLATCAACFWLAPGEHSQKGLHTLTGGFFACLLIRELDGLLDPINHGAWRWPLLAIALASCFIAFSSKNRVNTVSSLAEFAKGRVFGTLSTGFCILVFSRVFGMGALWHVILSDGYARLAKTTVEEGVELLAYSVWLAAGIDHYVRQIISRRSSSESKRHRDAKALYSEDRNTYQN
ncbi:hypothetical protein [Pseudomonas sp. ICMP 561]|uniref:hypothetical protein n=1 Tax=Pseudomonas sp. ICMP 561 TaxID=1718918 RepID=UPI0011457B66|nr:hypothetical protein [Pseudomonas sp. ICMP 561]